MSSGTWDRIAGNWKQFWGDAKAKWGDITDDEWLEIQGNREKLEGKIQERYGITKDAARQQVDEWADKLHS